MLTTYNECTKVVPKDQFKVTIETTVMDEHRRKVLVKTALREFVITIPTQYCNTVEKMKDKAVQIATACYSNELWEQMRTDTDLENQLGAHEWVVNAKLKKILPVTH